jgi:hypothetical protein
LLESLERTQLTTRCADISEFRLGRGVAASQAIDVLTHLLQHTQMPLGFGDESGVKGPDGRDMAIGVA